MQRRARSSSLTNLISAFDTKAQSHTEGQKICAFSGQFDKSIKPTFSREEYGKPIPGSLTEFRGAEAQARVCTEMKELCEIINQYGKTPCKGLLPPNYKMLQKSYHLGNYLRFERPNIWEAYAEPDRANTQRPFRQFNEMLGMYTKRMLPLPVSWNAHNTHQGIYTVISDKLVGILLRTRKHHLTFFEGEVLFQKRDDDVPVFLLMPIAEIRQYCDNKALQARRSVSPMPQ